MKFLKFHGCTSEIRCFSDRLCCCRFDRSANKARLLGFGGLDILGFRLIEVCLPVHLLSFKADSIHCFLGKFIIKININWYLIEIPNSLSFYILANYSFKVSKVYHMNGSAKKLRNF